MRAAAFFLLLVPSAALAEDVPPPFSVALRETMDGWDAASGGVRPGGTWLNKVQVSGTVRGDEFGLPGLAAHAQIFRTDGGSLGDRVGDIQTVSNIEAAPTFRLFEAWVQGRFGAGRAFVVRTGLIDLNSQFDANDTASLFINSSHGIGPDLARSGPNGPSIFPASAPAATLVATVARRWTLSLGVFDGVAGDPARPHAFVTGRLRGSDGALLIGQADYHLAEDATLEAGVWRYTVAAPDLRGSGRAYDQGAYGSISAKLPGTTHWTGWLRAGIANPAAQAVRAYLGGGVVATGLLPGRKGDRIGLAIAHAVIGGPAQRASALPGAETTVELTYQIKAHSYLALQPDLQYVHHPAGLSGARNALVFGLRAVLSAGYPMKALATDSADPTVSPEQ